MGRKFGAYGLLMALAGCTLDQPSPSPLYGYEGPSPGYGSQAYAPNLYAPTDDGAPNYPPPGYPPPPDYPPYPGYSYNDGAPTLLESGAAVPLIFFGGEWGFYDRQRHWHRAPDAVYRDLQRRQAFNQPYRPGAVSPGRPDWRSPPGGPPPGGPGGPPPGGRLPPPAARPPHPFGGGGGPAGFTPPPPPPMGHPAAGGAPPVHAPPPAQPAAPPPPRHPFPGWPPG